MNLNNLPLGPLYLTFNEEREVECERCKGKCGFIDEPPVGPSSWRKCVTCNGTGRKRIRVWGAVEVEVSSGVNDQSFPKAFAEVKVCNGIWMRNGDYQRLVEQVITAFLAGELPGDVARWIEKEDV